jgi:hypothetical protein
LAAGTVSSTVQYFSVTFQEHGYPNQNLDKDGQPAFILQQEFRSFKNLDPAENTKQQSQSLSSQKTSSKTAPSSNQQLHNFLCLPSSLQCNHASTSRYTSSNNEEQKLSDSVTSVSSRELNSLIMAIPNLNMQFVFQ